MSTHSPPAITDGSLLRSAERQIAASGADAPRTSALALLEHASGLGREQVITHPERTISPVAAGAYETLVARRCRREPLAYILGWREFFGRRFLVSEKTLIPRPETEGLVDLVLARLAGQMDGPWRILDVGTGSGAIALTLLAALPQATAVATDVEVDALRLAGGNAANLGVRSRVELVACDLASAFGRTFDIVAANLPYVPSARVESLEPEVRFFEPRRALDGGMSGTREILRMLGELPRLLAPGGAAFLEIDEDQSSELQAFAAVALPGMPTFVRPDGAGLDRYLVVERP